jgi:parallel beta-helix repeat protein
MSGKPIFISLVLLLYASGTFSSQYIVSPSGNDASSAGPWKTLQKAATTVVAGDTVIVEDGTYSGFVCEDNSGTSSKRIVIKARNKGAAIINAPLGTGSEGKNDGIVIAGRSFITIDGFEVTGAPRAGISIIGFEDDGSDATDNIIRNCWSHHNGGTSSAGRHDGIFTGFARSITIENNTVNNNSEHGIYVSNAADNPIIRGNISHDNTANGIQINADLSTGGDGLIANWLIENNIVYANTGAAGINLDGVINGVLRNNLLYNNSKAGITLFQGDGAEASHDNLVVNNTVYNPNGSRAALQVADGADNNVVFNNILYAGSGAGLEVQTVTGLVHDYNLVSKYDGAAASAHESSPAGTGLFANITGSDFKLSSNSAALNSGIATLSGKSAPSTDILGNPRPAGADVDRGCYEIQSMSTINPRPRHTDNSAIHPETVPTGYDLLGRQFYRGKTSPAFYVVLHKNNAYAPLMPASK